MHGVVNFGMCGADLCPSQLQSLAEDLQLAGVEGQRDGKFYKLCGGRW